MMIEHEWSEDETGCDVRHRGQQVARVWRDKEGCWSWYVSVGSTYAEGEAADEDVAVRHADQFLALAQKVQK
jgi:hypothetical protein